MYSRYIIMKMILTLTFISGVCLADYNGIVLTNEEEIIISEKLGFNIILIKKGKEYTDIAGAPLIPCKEFNYLIPNNATIDTIIINHYDEIEISGLYNLYPAQPPIPLDFSETPKFVGQDSVYYNQKEKYPSTSICLIHQFSTFDYKIATIRFYPIKYLPIKKKLFLLPNIDFTIKYKFFSTEKTQTQRRSTISQETLDKYIKSLVENPDDLSVMNGGPKEVSLQKTTTEKLDIKMSPTLDGNIVDYIIVTNELLKSEFQRLADWKTKKGIPTLIVTVEWIIENYPGCDIAEKIRNYLKEAKRNWGSIYLLLGGDVNIVPARYALVEGSKVTDIYYCDLEDVYLDPDYNWNSNGDNIFGGSGDNLDLGSDIYVGRAPVENVEEAEIFVDKVINYEHQTSDYVNNILLIGAHITDSCTDFIGQEDKNEIETYYIPPAKNRWEIYDDYMDPTYTGNEELDRTAVLNNLENVGTFHPFGYFHIVNWLDHGSSNSIGTGSKQGGGTIMNSDVFNLTNDSFYQIIWTYACSPNEFQKNSFSENYLNNPDGGAVYPFGELHLELI